MLEQGRDPRRFPGRALGMFARLQGLDRAMSLAARFFIVMIPLVAVLGAISSGPGTLGDRIVHVLGLTGQPAEAVRQLFATGDHGSSFGVFGVLILLYVLLSLSRALQRVYAELWELPRRPVSDSKEGLRWLPLAVLYGGSLWLEGRLAGSGVHAALIFLASFAVSAGFWTLTPWVLLGRRVPFLRLLPGGVLSAVGLALADVWIALYVPHAIERYVSSYGAIGVAMALITMLLVLSTVLVVAAVVAAALAAEPARDPMFLLEGVYGDVPSAEADYEALRGLREAGAIGSYDAAIVTRGADGRVHVTRSERPAEHGAWIGLAAGAALAVAAPVAMPALIAAGGAGLGAWVGRLARGISDADAQELAELLTEGGAALLVIGLERDARRIERTLDGAERHVTKAVDVDPDAAEREALAAIERS